MVKRQTGLLRRSRQILACFVALSLLSLLIFKPIHAQYDEETGMTEHESLRRSLAIDFLALHHNKDVDLSNNNDHREAAGQVIQMMQASLQERLSALFSKAKTPECRAKIAEHFTYFLNAIGKEEALPFSDIEFPNDCPEPVYDWDNLPEGMHIGHIQNRTYQPPRDEATYIDNPADLRLCYAILTHDSPAATIRLIETLYEEGHVFIIHVDGKESSDETHSQLVEYAKSRDYVHILGNSQRVRINWGGFSMVNATLQMLKYAFAVDSPDRKPLDFHKFFHVASTSYPLASRSEIRHKVASYPLDANFMHVIMKPTRPSPSVWHYFVECDDSLHRIYRLPPLQNATAGIELYTSSQWFIISREFAQYIAQAEKGTFVHQFLEYAEHVVVADETFFGTILRHTTFCTKHHNRNFLHLQFDRWESELPAQHRDEKKCMMKDPDHCGRSPTTMTVDYADILELSDDLFARKFVDSADMNVKDIVDQWRQKREAAFEKANETDLGSILQHHGVDFEGHGTLIVAKETVKDDVPLCLGIGESGNKLQLIPCFHDAVVPTLAENWETGAVILEETLPHNRWEVGPCTSDGHVERLPSADMRATKGNYSSTGPRCMLKQMDGIRAGRCLDTDSGSSQPGGQTQVFPCVNRWYQFVSFGDGSIAPDGSMFTTIPSHIVRQIHNLGHEQIPFMCLGVYGRGDKDEEDWEEEDNENERSSSDQSLNVAEQSERAEDSRTDAEWSPLGEWVDEEIITTQCTNLGAVIEWLFVPFIVEDEPQSSPNEDDGKPAIESDISSLGSISKEEL